MFFLARWDYNAPNWTSNYALQAQMTDFVDPMLHCLIPDSGGYMNQASPEMTTLKEDFYGVNYAHLRSVKAKYDKADLFYAKTAMGSDEWIAEPDGHLCV